MHNRREFLQVSSVSLASLFLLYVQQKTAVSGIALASVPVSGLAFDGTDSATFGTGWSFVGIDEDDSRETYSTFIPAVFN